MATKMSSSSSRTDVSGCRCPCQGIRPGRLVSRRSRATRSSCCRVSIRDLVASSRRSKSSLTSLSAWPAARRASAASEPRDFRSRVTSPALRPRKRSRTAWMPEASCARPSASSNSVRSEESRAVSSSTGGSRIDRSERPSGRRRARRFDQLRERSRILHRDLREGLAIERDARAPEARHELAVGEVVLPRRRVDADDPQSPEIAFLVPASGVGVVAGLVRCFLGELVELALAKEEALGEGEELLPLVAAAAPALDSRHGDVLRMAGRTSAGPPHFQASARPGPLDGDPTELAILPQKHLPHAVVVGVRHERPLPQVTLAARRLLGEDVALHRLVTLDLAARRQAEPLRRRAARLQLQLLLRLPHRWLSVTASDLRGFFSTAFRGPRIWIMVLPSRRGELS